MYEIAILYILNKYDATIYRVAKIIDEFFFSCFKSSLGTINPTLKRLEKAGCVVSTDKMSEGGMLSKIYSITPEGKKHLTDLLLSFKSVNPYHILNDTKAVLYCSDVLTSSEYAEFKENILNMLELHRIKLEKGLKNEYITLNNIQRKIAEHTLEETTKLIQLL